MLVPVSNFPLLFYGTLCYIYFKLKKICPKTNSMNFVCVRDSLSLYLALPPVVPSTLTPHHPTTLLSSRLPSHQPTLSLTLLSPRFFCITAARSRCLQKPQQQHPRVVAACVCNYTVAKTKQQTPAHSNLYLLLLSGFFFLFFAARAMRWRWRLCFCCWQKFYF